MRNLLSNESFGRIQTFRSGDPRGYPEVTEVLRNWVRKSSGYTALSPTIKSTASTMPDELHS
jgi:hypothetical protein